MNRYKFGAWLIIVVAIALFFIAILWPSPDLEDVTPPEPEKTTPAETVPEEPTTPETTMPAVPPETTLPDSGGIKWI